MVELIRRRSFLFGLGSLLAAPAVVKASSLMPISSAKLILPDTQIIGAIKANVGVVLEGWVVCDGRWLERNTYSDLHAVIGDIYGDAPLDAFVVPNLTAQAEVERATGKIVGRYVIYAGQQQTRHKQWLNSMTDIMPRREGDPVATIEGRRV